MATWTCARCSAARWTSCRRGMHRSARRTSVLRSSVLWPRILRVRRCRIAVRHVHALMGRQNRRIVMPYGRIARVAVCVRCDTLVGALRHGLGDGVTACCELRSCRPRVHAPAAAVVADSRTRDACRVDHPFVHVRIVDHRAVDSHHGRVVVEDAAGPKTADESRAEIAEPVVDSAVESDARTPIARIPKVRAVDVPPITGRPVIADDRRSRPIRRYPIVARRFPSPSSPERAASPDTAPVGLSRRAAPAAGTRPSRRRPNPDRQTRFRRRRSLEPMPPAGAAAMSVAPTIVQTDRAIRIDSSFFSKIECVDRNCARSGARGCALNRLFTSHRGNTGYA